MPDAHGTALQVWYDGAWNTAPALHSTRIGIVVGLRGEGQDGQPNELTAELRSTGQEYSPLNAEGVLFGKAGRNTPLRVRADSSTRCHVEASTWTPTQSLGGHGRTGVSGGGVLRRVQAGTVPIRSAAFSAFTAPVNDPVRVAYFPFEEQAGATAVDAPYGGSVTLGGPGSIEFGALTSLTSARLAKFATFDTYLTFVLPDWTDTLGQHFAGSLLRFPAGGLANNAVIWRWYFTGGTVDYVDLLHTTGEVLQLVAYRGGAVLDTMAIADWTGFIDDREVFLWVTFEQVAGDVAVRVRANGSTYWLAQSTDTLAGQTMGRMYKAVMGTGSGTDGLGFGHVIFGSNRDGFGNFIDDQDSDPDVLVTGARGYDRERAGRRFLRICAERGIPAAVIGDADDTQRMGPQPIDTPISILRECVRTDAGMLLDGLDEREVWMRTGRSMCNQDPVLELSFTGSEIAPGLAPDLGNRDARNLITVVRRNGGTVQASQTTGPLNTSDPTDDPDGIGPVEGKVDVNTDTDEVLTNHAHWHLARGTAPEPRFPAITVDLTRAPGLITAANALLPGDRITAADLPAGYAIDVASLLAVGWRENLPPNRRTLSLVCVPAAPYEVAVVGAADGSVDLRGQAVDTDLSVLEDDVVSGAGAFDVTSSGGVRWTTNADDWNPALHGGGLYLLIGGEVMRVTGITGSGATQAFAVVRSVNGVVKGHAAGTPVHVRYPARVGL